MILIIDELDRFNPIYVSKVLETIKDFYDFSNITIIYVSNIIYKEDEFYKNMSERLKIFSKVDIYKVNKYRKKEFDNNFFIVTNLMHNVVWNSPEEINIHGKI